MQYLSNVKGKVKERVQYLSAVATLAATNVMFPLYAEGEAGANGGWGSKVSINGNFVNTSIKSIMGSVIGVIITVAQYLGLLLAIWGLVMFGLAMKNEDAESKNKALMAVIAGVVLISIKFVLQAVGFIGAT